MRAFSSCRSSSPHVLLPALDDYYFMNQSQNCLGPSFRRCEHDGLQQNARYEKLIMRSTERQDVLIGRFDDYSLLADLVL